MKIGTRFVLVIGALLLCLAAHPALAADETQQTQTTDHYKVTLTIAPAETMLMPEQAAGAKEGEVMVQMPGRPMPMMSDNDQGHPVNHHLEISVVDPATGGVAADYLPTITITNHATGEPRVLTDVMQMYDVQKGAGDTHFGNNVYLADGTYTITAVVNNGETATFANVQVGASGGNMNMGGGSAMPTSGESLTALYGALLAAGALVLGVGLWLRRARRIR